MKMLFCVILGLAAVSQAQDKPKPKPAAATKYECKETQDEKCPDPADYAHVKEWLARYAAPQEQQDYFNGLVTRLFQKAPAGYHLDNTKWVYVKNPPEHPTAPSLPADKK